jgi:hypothetical protein
MSKLTEIVLTKNGTISRDQVSLRARTKRGGFWHWQKFMTAASIGGVGLQIVRDWMLRFNARGPDGLLDGKAPGRQSLLNDAQRRGLVEMVECGPIP